MTIAEGEPCWQNFLCLGIPLWIFQDSTFQSIFPCFPPPSFCTYSGQIVSITKTSQQRRWIACNRADAAGPDIGELCTVGGIWFPELYPCCALEDAPGQLTWACICPEGHEVLAHLSTSWRQGDMAWGSQNATAQPCLHNWALPTVSPCTLCKGWEKVSWWGLVLDRKWGFYLFLCAIRAFPAGRIPDSNLVVQLTARMQPARGDRNVFQAIPEQQQQQLTPVTPVLCCALSPLRKPCFSNGIVCCLEDGFHCVNPTLFCQKKTPRK